MKMKLLALLVIAALPLMAFDCITDPSKLTISLKVSPLGATFLINPGTNTQYSGMAPAINPASLVSSGYTLTGASIYDITVQTTGPEDLGNGSGTVFVAVGSKSRDTLFTYSGTWTQFNTPQSLLASSAIALNQSGANDIVAALTSQPPLQVTFSAAGTVKTAPSKADDYLTVQVYMQASGHKN